MHPKIESYIEWAIFKFGLEHYTLERHHLYRSINQFNETVYSLSMEWFPGHHTQQEQDTSDYNPIGTAVIDLDIDRSVVNSILFVGGKSYASRSMFSSMEDKEIKKWIEAETGLRFGVHLQLAKQNERTYSFTGCIDGIALSPPASIELEFDQEGRLTKYTKVGYFPSVDEVIVECYSLSLDRVEPLLTEQIQLMEVPIHEHRNLISLYGVEEIFVTNDGLSAIPFEFNSKWGVSVVMDKVVEWETPINASFTRKKIRWQEELTFEQASSGEKHPDALPITELDLEECWKAILHFLRQVYGGDSGKWLLQKLHREKGMIHATLKAGKQDLKVFQRKLLIMMDRERHQVLNFMDNEGLLDTFDGFQASEPIRLDKDEALVRLRERIHLTPYYVYHVELKKYILCGKLDCDEAVHASSGKIMALRDL
ncbi:hypothetical protein [Paenibacillus luteus]|uniref:hypothetical protein n=1 Tax=Paenibacillus luteus TaxID=2545753 RepID=UPI0011421BAA|nr:hypothetical protein [Paenibacillus luteus]